MSQAHIGFGNSRTESELLHALIEGNYRIIYKINSDNIGIVRIHHAARQLK